MKKAVLVLAALTIYGCEKETCSECVDSITSKVYSPTGSVIKFEQEEVVRVLCDEQEIAGWDGAFSQDEVDLGNQGYYKITTTITNCN